MSVMRVTHNSIGTRSLAGLQTNLDKLSKLQEQLSSGKQINRPSDSPTGTVSALRFRSEIRQAEQHARNAADGLGWLGTIDSTLTTSLGSVNRVRDLTLQAKNTGASSPEARQALATEVKSLRDALVGMANTTYLGRPVFGGTTSGSTAYDATGAYLGDTHPVVRTVGDNTTLDVDANGPSVFGAGAESLFQVLTDIASHMEGDTDLLSADLTRLDAVMKNMQNKLSEVGARYARVEQAGATADDRVLRIKEQLSEVEYVDIAKTVVDLQMQEMAYEAALGATARVIQPSLMDFLR